MTFDAFGIKRNRTFARADACRVELACRSTRICLLAQKEESARKSPLYFVTIATAARPPDGGAGRARRRATRPRPPPQSPRLRVCFYLEAIFFKCSRVNRASLRF